MTHVESGHVLEYDVDFGGDRNEWQNASRYQIWSRHYDAGAPPLNFFERRPEGFVQIPNRPRLFHLIPTGVPHHIQELFGFWRISDGDTIFIRADDDTGVSYTVIVGTVSPEYKVDHIVWYCQSCGAELSRATFQTRRFGVPAFWAKSLEDVRAFNADVARRECPSCGVHHPLAYGFDDRADNEPEREVRTSW